MPVGYDQRRLFEAIATLEKYHGLAGRDDLIQTMALESIIADPQRTNARANQTPVINPNAVEVQILSEFFQDRNSFYSMGAFIQRANDIANTPETKTKFNQTFQIFYSKDHQANFVQTNAQAKTFLGTNLGYEDIKTMISGENQSQTINRLPTQPDKENPGLSIVLSNTHRLGFNQQFGNLLSLWLNSIPTVEIARAMPYMNIMFNTPRKAIDNQGRLSAMGLNKFIYGASQADRGSSLFITTQANESEINGQPSTIAGMEIFTSPVGLISDQQLTSTQHSAKVLERFHPMLAIESLDINVAPSNGLSSFKTATLVLTLFDRSRLSDIAEFIRPEYYGLNEVILEYGWYHPDGQQIVTPARRNPYGDIINNLKVKEKYGVVNSSFSFGEGGIVKVTLELAMRGGNDMLTTTIASDQDNMQSILRELELVREVLTQLRARYPDGRIHGREIRGFDILNSLSDSTLNYSLGRDFLNELKRLRQSLVHIPNGQQGVEAINRLVQTNQQNQATGGIIPTVQRTILNGVSAKVQRLINGKDPMLLQVVQDNSHSLTTVTGNPNESGSFATLPTQGRNDLQNALRANGITDLNSLPNGQFSFAKLLLEFVGVPLASTNKYDDIQFVFYPFNIYAGRANRLNIGNFGIDARYFIIKYMEWRLSRLNQSLNVNLHEFMRFVLEQIVSDPAMKSYGLYSPQGHTRSRGFEYYVENNTIGTRVPSVGRSNNGDDSAYLEQISRALEGVTPNAEFRPPQIEFHIETVPMKMADGTVDDTRSVLRIHVFDRVASSFESLAQLQNAARENTLNNIGMDWTTGQSSILNVQTPQGTNAGPNNPNEVYDSARNIMNSTIDRAKAEGLIEVVPDRPNEWRIKGGPDELRKFFYANSPHFIFGAGGSTVKGAQFGSLQDAALSTINMLRNTQRVELESNGENPGGLPMQVAPGEVNLNLAFGNPLISYIQTVFCDFLTGTTIDGFYAITGITHKLAQGVFETNLRLTPTDSWGKYINILRIANTYRSEIDRLQQNQVPQQQAPQERRSRGRTRSTTSSPNTPSGS